ncbi:MAG: LLM class flavin-dependent oxidoreductase [Acidimicrobiales bacterium]
MRFGLFYEHQLPRPWEAGDEERLLHDALEQIEFADSVGLDYVWEVEHHFLEEYSHSSAPEVFLAAASQRTKQIRLGHGIVQLPVEVNHPARVAERIATLDLLSKGRVDFGTGEGSSQAELGGYGVPRDAKREQWDEALDVVCRMLTEAPFTGHRGKWVDAPPRNVVPKPKQQPHPPLWLACSRRETIELAGRKGMGVLSFSFVEPEDAKPWVETYHELLASEECIPAGFAVNPNFAVVVPFMCHPDEEIAIERGIDGAHFFGYSLAHYYVFGRHRPGRTSLADEFDRYRHERGFARDIIRAANKPLDVKLLDGAVGSLRGAIGTPEQIADLCARYQAAGVDQVIFVAQAGRNRHEHICEALELFGREVLPRFADDKEAIEEAKRERLAGAMERALARRPRPPARDVDNYVIATTGELTPARTPRIGHARLGLTQRTPRRAVERGVQAVLATIVNRVPDAVIRRVGGTPVAALVYRQGMEQVFRAANLGRLNAVLRFELTDGNGTQAWNLVVRDGKAKTTTNGPGPKRPAGVAGRSGQLEPDAILRFDVVEWLAIIAGVRSPGESLFEGKFDFEGDETKALAIVGAIDPAHSPF